VPTHKEPRWTASLAVLAALALYWLLPETLTLGPTWVLLILELALLILLSIVAPTRRKDEPRWQRYAAVALIALIALIALVNVANIVSLALFVHDLLQGKANGKQIVGAHLLFSSILIWLTNVLVFDLWYWKLDRGGPDDRSHPAPRQPDFLFPQMTTPHCTHAHWTLTFLDYLYVSFTNATAFSPTDTMPLTPWAKALMVIQAFISLLTIALVAARGQYPGQLRQARWPASPHNVWLPAPLSKP
jgi:uncharacterized membrane protein